MSLDARVKAALERSSQIVDPDVRRDLSTVRRKTRRLALRQRIVTTVAVAALIVLGVFLVPRIDDVIRNQRRVPAHTPSSSALAGSYRVDLTGSGEPVASAGLAGAWTLTFQVDGTVLWTAPSGSRLTEGLPSDTYQQTGQQMVTSMFVGNICRGKGVGTYSWTVSGDALTLFPVRDDCAIRRAILASAPWSAGP